MRTRLSILVFGLALFGAATALAQDKPACKSGEQVKKCGKKAGQQVAGKQCPGKSGGKSDCPDKDAVTGMPMMFYKVGDQQFCCEKGATEAAKGDAGQIRFVVGDQTFEAKPDALKAYAKALDKFLMKITTVQYASSATPADSPAAAGTRAKERAESASYQVATYKFDDQKLAEKAAKAAKEAAEQVAMTWTVGGEKFECPMTAKQAAKQSGKPLEYCVGKTKTDCELTAKVELAKAKIAEAVKVIAKHARSS